MNFLAQSTPLTPKKHRSSTAGLHSSNLSTSSLQHSSTQQFTTPQHNQVECSTPTRRLSQSPKKQTRTPPSSHSDRFIPNRNNIDFEYCNNQLFSCYADVDENSFPGQQTALSPNGHPQDESSLVLNFKLRDGLQQSPDKRMLSFTNNNNHDDPSINLNMDMSMNHSSLKRSAGSCQVSKVAHSSKKKALRVLPAGPSKILDAPGRREE
jgi:hypothetical protein